MVAVLVTVVIATAWVIGASILAWWATEGSVFHIVALGAFTASVAFGRLVPMALSLWNPGSVRRAKRDLVSARQERRHFAVAHARLRLAVVRWQRRK